MKKLFLLLLGLTIAIVASAEPADPTPITVTQPCGETLLLRLVGEQLILQKNQLETFKLIFSCCKSSIYSTWKR